MSDLEETRIFLSYEEELARIEQAYRAIGEPLGGEADIAAETSLRFASGISVVCSYSDALGLRKFSIEEPEWVFDPDFELGLNEATPQDL